MAGGESRPLFLSGAIAGIAMVAAEIITCKQLYRLSEALVERDGVVLPQTPCRSSGVYDNGAPHGAFTWVESAREIDGLL